MKVSIITICFNNENDIRGTIESVVSQDYDDIEYIVKDGGSTDNTVNIINEYRDRISKIIVSKDRGIYDALNQGIQAATGDIVGFIHAGDRLFDHTTISQIAKFHNENDVDISYGDNQTVTPYGKVKRTHKSVPYNKCAIRYGYMPSHLTVYTKRSLFDKFGYYLTDFGSAADYEWIVRYFYKHSDDIRFKNHHICVDKFTLGGISSKHSISKVRGAYNEMMKSAWTVNGYKPIPGLIYLRALWICRSIIMSKFKSN